MNERRLAIVIPTYNRKLYLEQALNSILQQDCPTGWSFHVVVVDDGSSDGTFEFIEGRFKTIKILRKENGERGAARNFGASWAIKELNPCWLLFFDSDDILLPSALKHFMFIAEKKSIMVAAYGAIRAWDGCDVLPNVLEVERSPEGDLSRLVAKKPVLPLGATFLKTAAFLEIGGFSENRKLSGSEDWVFLARLMLSGEIFFIPHLLTLYRQHGGNTDPERSIHSIQLAMMEMTPYLESHFKDKNMAKALQRLGTLLKAGTLSSHSQPGNALRLIYRSLFQDAGLLFDVRALKLLASIGTTLVIASRRRSNPHAIASG
jgi:glycosyltransferase involved in cell wall biosynthesis